MHHGELPSDPKIRLTEQAPYKPAPAQAGVLLGHRDLSTTARYTQVAATTIGNTISPFDRLKLEEADPA